MKKKLIEVTTSNESFAMNAAGIVIGLGLFLSFYGAHSWYNKIQVRDDKLAQLQLEKVELEVVRLRHEAEQYVRRPITMDACGGGADSHESQGGSLV